MLEVIETFLCYGKWLITMISCLNVPMDLSFESHVAGGGLHDSLNQIIQVFYKSEGVKLKESPSAISSPSTKKDLEMPNGFSS